MHLSGADKEQNFWDEQARGDARQAVWAIAESEWRSTTDRCVALVTQGLGALPEDGTVAELGCGIGRLTLPIARSFPNVNVVGVDVSGEMLRRARLAAAEEGIDNLRFRECDGRTWPGWPRPLDGAWSVVTFQHIPRRAIESYVAQISESLRSGAQFLFQVVVGDEDQWLNHHLSESAVAAVCDASGMRVTSMRTDDLQPNWLWVTARRT